MILGLNFKESCLHCFLTFWNPTLIYSKSSYLLMNYIQPPEMAVHVTYMTKGHALKVDSSVTNISIAPPQLY